MLCKVGHVLNGSLVCGFSAKADGTASYGAPANEAYATCVFCKDALARQYAIRALKIMACSYNVGTLCVATVLNGRSGSVSIQLSQDIASPIGGTYIRIPSASVRNPS